MYPGGPAAPPGRPARASGSDTVIAGGPLWSGNTPPRAASGRTRRRRCPSEPTTRRTPMTVHALLLLYAAGRGGRGRLGAGGRGGARAARGRRRPPPAARSSARRERHRPRAFRLRRRPVAADALRRGRRRDERVVLATASRPARRLARGAARRVPARPYQRPPREGAGPGRARTRRERRAAAGLPPHGAPEGFRNFGLNGSYMVVRELQQDVAAFWKSMDEAPRGSARTIPSSDARDRRLARRAGRRPRPRRHLLCPGGTSRRRTNTACRDNNFGFFDTRPARPRLPAGLHVRRANPRDGLAPDDGRRRQTLLDAANNHRILRRGRKYGTDDRAIARRTTARTAACCSSASTPTSRGSSSSCSRPGC